MIGWLAPLVAGSAAAPCAWLAVVRRRGQQQAAPLVRAPDLGLERLTDAGTLVQFSCYACHPCRVSLNRLAEAAAHSSGTVVVELPLERGGRLARELRVHSAPTVLLLDGHGRVRRRWSGPPERGDLARSLAGGGRYEAAAAGSMSKLRA